MAKDLDSSIEKRSISNGRDGSKLFWHNKKLLSISLWANRFSWIILFLYTINFLARTVFELDFQGLRENYGNFYYDLAYINRAAHLWAMPVIGLVYFLILQTISGSILILLDVDNSNGNESLHFLIPKNIMRYIPLCANGVSWTILVLYTIYSLSDVTLNFPELIKLIHYGGDYYSYIDRIAVWSIIFINLVIGIIYFLILQTISNGIRILQERKP